MKKYYEIGDVLYEVKDRVQVTSNDGTKTTVFPVIDMPMMSDYYWHLTCLESRLQQPHLYADSEDIEEVKRKLVETLLEQTTPDLYVKYYPKHKMVYDYISGGVIE